jgi:hypothetical protein
MLQKYHINKNIVKILENAKRTRLLLNITILLSINSASSFVEEQISNRFFIHDPKLADPNINMPPLGLFLMAIAALSYVPQSF